MSAINTGTINVNYPVPGVNNNSQGFRTNFAGIKTNLDTAGTEIGDLQSKAVVKSALTGITLNNDMANTLISNAAVQGFRATTFNLGSNLTGTVTVDVTKGDVQYGTITGNVALAFSKWGPTGTQSNVEVIITASSSLTNAVVVNLPTNVNRGTLTADRYSGNGTGGNITVLPNSFSHYVFTTTDCGDTVELIQTNLPRKANQVVTTVPTTNRGQSGDVPGLIAADANYVYVCVAAYTDGVAAIWKRTSLASY